MGDVEDRLLLQDLMLSYAAALDEKDMVLYRTCFADDVDVVGFGDTPIEGADKWVASVESQLKAFKSTQHLLSPQLAHINGDTAVSRMDVQAIHYLAEDPGTTFILWGTYHTNFIRCEGDWKITRHELVTRGTRKEP